MAYADYQQNIQPVPNSRLPTPGGESGPFIYRPGGSPTFDEGAAARPAPTMNGAGQLPTNTRSQNLASVQQAYARPPGDMGYLNDLLAKSSSPVSASDPSIAPAFAAGRVADQRNIDRQRSALAEQLGNQGLGQSGAMNTRTQGIQQHVGEQAALRESGMLYDESNARRNALLQGLGLDQSRYQGDNDLGYRLAALEAQLNGQAVQPFLSY